MKKIILVTLAVFVSIVFGFYFLNKNDEELSSGNVSTSTSSNSQNIEDKVTPEGNIGGTNGFPGISSVDLGGIHSSRMVAVGTTYYIVIKTTNEKEYLQAVKDIGVADIFLCYKNNGPEECLLIENNAKLIYPHAEIAQLTIDSNVPVNSDAYIKLMQSNKPESMVKSPLFKVVESIDIGSGRAYFRSGFTSAQEYDNGLVGLSVGLKTEGGSVYISKDPDIALEISNSTSVQIESIETEFSNPGSSDDYFWGASAFYFNITVRGIDLDDEQFLENSRVTLYYSDDPSNLRKFKVTKELKDFSIMKF